MGWGLIIGCIFFCLQVDGHLYLEEWGGGASKWGWGEAYKRQFTILYVNHDRGLILIIRAGRPLPHALSPCSVRNWSPEEETLIKATRSIAQDF